ncbi:hypothetical protein [Alcanivorax sp.]|uniref:hypothetical protein n=1 Tax=Alcanivorax sp. TaxID=1872427 RepID=UPI0025BCC424|nr:hypothetical protein [Alcanivorax sp.]
MTFNDNRQAGPGMRARDMAVNPWNVISFRAAFSPAAAQAMVCPNVYFLVALVRLSGIAINLSPIWAINRH